MGCQRCLIVNADDFGQSAGVNRGIAQAHEHGIVASTSLMVRWPAALEAADYARRHPALSVGLHLDFGEWAYRQGEWVPVYEVAAGTDAAAVGQELARQLEAFRRLLGRDPSHLDSHQHVHREEPLRSLALEVAGTLGIPLRHFTDRIQYCGGFYGQTAKGTTLPGAVNADSLIRILRELPPGVSELGCHPGYASDLSSMYRSEREQEVETLCDPRVRAVIDAEGIRLRSFNDWKELNATTS